MFVSGVTPATSFRAHARWSEAPSAARPTAMENGRMRNKRSTADARRRDISFLRMWTNAISWEWLWNSPELARGSYPRQPAGSRRRERPGSGRRRLYFGPAGFQAVARFSSRARASSGELDAQRWRSDPLLLRVPLFAIESPT